MLASKYDCLLTSSIDERGAIRGLMVKCLPCVLKALVEFFGALLGIQSILDRPRYDYSKRAPTIDHLSNRY